MLEPISPRACQFTDDGPPILQRVCVYTFGPCEGPDLRWRKRGRVHSDRDGDVSLGGIWLTELRRCPWSPRVPERFTVELQHIVVDVPDQIMSPAERFSFVLWFHPSALLGLRIGQPCRRVPSPS